MQRKGVVDALAGIELGIIGGLAMLVWLTLTSPLVGKPWWWAPNLFASWAYGRGVLTGVGMATLAGTAIHLALSGLVGLVNGITTTGGRLFGLGVATAWYLLCYF